MCRAQRPLALAIVFALVLALRPLCAAEAVSAAPETGPVVPKAEESSIDRTVDAIKNPTYWFHWGFDIRLRQEYYNNALDLDFKYDDRRDVLRPRGRIWAELGKFFSDQEIKERNGLSLYARITGEPRIWLDGYSQPGEWNEVCVDNLYLDYTRILSAPISERVGRQDLAYGKGLVIMDGTPNDGSRTMYFDASKTVVNLDPIQTQVDVLAIWNQGRESRIAAEPDANRATWPFNQAAGGVYITNKSVQGQEFQAYYLYKDETPIDSVTLPGRTVNCVGLYAAGVLPANFDYYGELGYQWGKEGAASRQGYAGVSELGYTLKAAPWTPRVHVGYEYLSGDDPNTSTYEGWDPMFGQWVRWSELLFYRWSREYGGRAGQWTNLQRGNLGIEVRPMKDLSFTLDYNLVLANHHEFGEAYPYSDGWQRGQLVAAKLSYKFNRYWQGHLLGEYFFTGDYYAESTDDAYFLRWQIELTF